MNKKTIGEKIKMLRLSHDFTQEELGKMVNINKQLLYKYENGIITNIPSSKIEKIAKALNTTPAFLMGWDDAQESEKNNIIIKHIYNLTDDEQILVDNFRIISDEKQDMILTTIQALASNIIKKYKDPKYVTFVHEDVNLENK